MEALTSAGVHEEEEAARTKAVDVVDTDQVIMNKIGSPTTQGLIGKGTRPQSKRIDSTRTLGVRTVAATVEFADLAAAQVDIS